MTPPGKDVSLSATAEVIGVMRIVLRYASAVTAVAVLAAVLATSPAAAEAPEAAAVAVQTANSAATGVSVQVASPSGTDALEAAEGLASAGGGSATAGVVLQASGLCDASGVSQFGDVAADGYGADHILCARALELTRGRADGSFGPDDELTREQMAAFLVRLWRDVLDRDCPAGVSHGFRDIAGSFAKADIECLFGLGIAKGTTASTFSPGRTLSTAAVTLFLARLLVRSGAAACDLSTDEFQRAAECLADRGVAATVGEAVAPVAATRAMMAVYLVGAWHQASGRGRPPRALRPVVTAVVTNDAPLRVDHPAGLSVSVPADALAGSTRLVVSKITAVPPAQEGAAKFSDPVFDVTAFSASGRQITETDAAMELRFPEPPGGDGGVIARYDGLLHKWIPVATSAEGGELIAELDQFAPVVAWSWPTLPAWLRDALSSVWTGWGWEWLADGLTEDESLAVRHLREIVREDPHMAKTLLGFPWLADGINKHESSGALYGLLATLRDDPNTAESLLGLPSLADGLAWEESWALGGLGTLYGIDRSISSALTTRPWFKDGLSYEELMLVGDLGNIAYRSETHFTAIIGMPFMETFEPADAMAVIALMKLAYCWDCSDDESSDGVPESFRRVMTHPAISDGISDEEAKVVATLHTVSLNKPDLLDTLLAPDNVTLEERIVDLPLAGEVLFTIIRTETGLDRTMDLLEYIVRSVEGFMAYPLPVKQVIYLSADTGNASNHWTTMVFPPEFDTHEASEVLILHVLAHEVAHYYWRGEWALPWISEGAATFFQSLHRMQANAAAGEPVVPIWPAHWPPCTYVGNIAGLDRLERGIISESAHLSAMCYYSHGERLWQDLYRSLGESVFRRGYRNLHLMLRGVGSASQCEDSTGGICHVEAAFKAAAPADMATTVDTVIARWYDNSEPYDISHVDTSPINPNLSDSIEISRSYISLDSDRREETMTDSFSASDIQENIFLHLHFSSPTVQKARKLPLTLVEYFEDGFSYSSHSVTYTLEAGRHQISPGFPIGPGGHTWVEGDFEDRTWAPGRYWVYVYHEGQKVAEVKFRVTP